jgi:hypothetical protein
LNTVTPYQELTGALSQPDLEFQEVPPQELYKSTNAKESEADTCEKQLKKENIRRYCILRKVIP